MVSGEHRTWEMLPCWIVFPATSGLGEGSSELARGVQDCLWECKSQRQRLGPERPEGQATGFLFFFEQMVKPPDACLSGHVSTVPGNPLLSLPVTVLSSLLITGALVTFQRLGIFLQGSQTSKRSANRFQGDP